MSQPNIVHQDEREPYRHLGDCEKVAYRFYLAHATRRYGSDRITVVLSFNGDDIVHVAFPSELRDQLDELGYPRDSWVDGYVEGAARIDYVRSGR